MRLRGFIGAIAIGLVGCGCTVLTSDLPSDLIADGRPPDGVNYMLPKGVVTVTLAVNEKSGIFDLSVSDPEYVPDTSHRFFLRYRPHPTYEDKITVTMLDDGRPFVKSISADTTDRTKDIIVNLAKAAAFAGGFHSGANQRVLAEIVVDPINRDEVQAALGVIDAEMRRYIDDECVRLTPPDDEAKARCANFKTLLSDDKSLEPLLNLSVSPPSRSRSSGTLTDCSVGICYRPKEPYLMAYSIAGVTKTKVIEIPNGTYPIAIDIRRAFLVQKIQTIAFDTDGFLSKVTISKNSELLAAAQIPIAVVDAVAEGLQLRINYTQENTKIANQEAELLRKRADLRDKQRASDKQFHSATQERVQAESASTYAMKEPSAEEPPPAPAAPAPAAPNGPSGPPPTDPPIDPDLEHRDE